MNCEDAEQAGCRGWILSQPKDSHHTGRQWILSHQKDSHHRSHCEVQRHLQDTKNPKLDSPQQSKHKWKIGEWQKQHAFQGDEICQDLLPEGSPDPPTQTHAGLERKSLHRHARPNVLDAQHPTSARLDRWNTCGRRPSPASRTEST